MKFSFTKKNILIISIIIIVIVLSITLPLVLIKSSSNTQTPTPTQTFKLEQTQSLNLAPTQTQTQSLNLEPTQTQTQTLKLEPTQTLKVEPTQTMGPHTEVTIFNYTRTPVNKDQHLITLTWEQPKSPIAGRFLYVITKCMLGPDGENCKLTGKTSRTGLYDTKLESYFVNNYSYKINIKNLGGGTIGDYIDYPGTDFIIPPLT